MHLIPMWMTLLLGALLAFATSFLHWGIVRRAWWSAGIGFLLSVATGACVRLLVLHTDFVEHLGCVEFWGALGFWFVMVFGPYVAVYMTRWRYRDGS
ncbi:hypothetical protein ACFL26_00315 [Patescibacteria group bacterium]